MIVPAASAFASTPVGSALLAGSPANSTSTINDVEPGVLGFLIVAGMGLALVFLIRSMNKQFRKIGPKPEEDLLLDGTVPGEVLAREDDRSTVDAGSAD